MIIESIEEGFRLTNRNWQLILLNVAATVASIISLFILVGVPIAMAITSVGMDFSQAESILPGILQNPMEIFSKYMGLITLILIAFAVYLTVASVVFLYVFGGMLGILKNTATDAGLKFSYPSFFTEAKKLFFPLMWLFSVSLLLFTAVIVVFALLAVLVFPALRFDSGSGPAIPVFISYFVVLMSVLSCLSGVLAVVILTAYATVSLIVEKVSVMESFRHAVKFVTQKPAAFVFYFVLVLFILAANILLAILNAVMLLIPVLGILFQFLSYAFQIYLSIVMWSALIVFYVRSIDYPVRMPENITYSI